MKRMNLSKYPNGSAPISRSAFTLIEMLVVVTIVLLLLGLTAGAVSRATLSAQRTQCMSNMRQIGAAILMYATENRGALPETRHSQHDAEQAWIYLLAPFLSNMDEIRISPADPLGAERLRRGSTSYLLNDVVFGPSHDVFGRPIPNAVRGLTDLPQPTRTLFSVIASDNVPTGPTNDHAHVTQWTTWPRFLRDVEADRFRQGNRSADRTRGDANYLFGDGSVQNLRASVLKTSIESGTNPGLPGQAPR